jgi:hypothetical protein
VKYLHGPRKLIRFSFLAAILGQLVFLGAVQSANLNGDVSPGWGGMNSGILGAAGESSLPQANNPMEDFRDRMTPGQDYFLPEASNPLDHYLRLRQTHAGQKTEEKVGHRLRKVFLVDDHDQDIGVRKLHRIAALSQWALRDLSIIQTDLRALPPEVVNQAVEQFSAAYPGTQGSPTQRFFQMIRMDVTNQFQGLLQILLDPATDATRLDRFRLTLMEEFQERAAVVSGE